MNTTEVLPNEIAVGIPAPREDYPFNNVDENFVDFDGPGDLDNPLSWSFIYKWGIVILISVMSLVV